MEEQYKNTITVARFELFDQYLLITYKNQKNKIVYYKEIKDLKHYCGGRSGVSGCRVSIYTKDENIKLPYLKGNDATQAKALKAELFAKMNK